LLEEYSITDSLKFWKKKSPNKKYGFCVGFARFRISAPIRRQIKAGIQKKIYCTACPVAIYWEILLGMLANDTRSEFFFKNHCCLRIDLKEKWNFRQTDWVPSPFGDFPPKINRWWPYLEKVLQLHIVYYLLLVHFYSNPAADYVHKILTLPLVYEPFWKERFHAANFFSFKFWGGGGEVRGKEFSHFSFVPNLFP
jgi:hypothetical protein